MPAFLLRYLPHIAAVLCVAIFAGGLYAQGRISGKAAGEAIAAAAVQERDQAISALKASQEAAETARKISEDFHDEIDRLRSRKPARTVRVCPDPGVPVPAGTAAGTDAASATGGQLPQDHGFDIGSSLYSEADRAGEVAAQLRALQSWLREVR